MVVAKCAKRVVPLVIFDFCQFLFHRGMNGRSFKFSRSAFLKRLVIVETGVKIEPCVECWEFGFLFINDVGGRSLNEGTLLNLLNGG